MFEHLKLEKGSDNVWWSNSGLSNSSWRRFLASDGLKFLAFNSEIFWLISFNGNRFFKKIFLVVSIAASRATSVDVVLLHRYSSPTNVDIL